MVVNSVCIHYEVDDRLGDQHIHGVSKALQKAGSYLGLNNNDMSLHDMHTTPLPALHAHNGVPVCVHAAFG